MSEFLMLFGILMTAGGYNSFELVGLKGDLGALAFGWLLAAYPKASELTDRYGKVVISVDFCAETVVYHQAKGRNVV